MSDYDSTTDTLKHIKRVNAAMLRFSEGLTKRAQCHDDSKLRSPEKEIFDVVTPELRGLTYGSEEYKASLDKMGEALQHHYKNNSHHPEHYENGVLGFDLLDLVEMFCDWTAAVERHADGDIYQSIEINTERFQLGHQLAAILKNTAKRSGL